MKCLQGEQAALLAPRSQASAEEAQHLLGRNVGNRRQRFTFQMLNQHRCGRLADDAATGGECSLTNDSSAIHVKLNADAVAARGIVDPPLVRGVRKHPTAVRLFKVPQHMFFVNRLFVGGHPQLSLLFDSL